MYTAADEKELWADEGTLHAFVADGTRRRLLRPPAGETIHGTFVDVPENIAKGEAADGHELTRADFPGYPAPFGGPSLPPDGPQWILDQWGNVANNPSVEGNNVFDFIRLEDIAYDKRTTSNIVYLADSGRADGRRCGPAGEVDERAHLQDGVLDPDDVGDPTEASISILVQGDDNPTGSYRTRWVLNQ